MVNFPYNTTDFAFTLDDVFINFSTTTAETYFDLEITIKYYDFFSSTEKTEVLEYKVPLFNLEQSYNVGRKIHRFLSNPEVYANTYGFQYKTAKVSFLIKEIKIADETTVETITLDHVFFIAGPKPTLIANNNAILTTNSNFERVTQNGLFIVNFLLSEGEHTVNVFKNSVAIETEIITATALDNVFSKKIVVKDFSGAKGDVFELNINGAGLKKNFVVFPDGEYSKQLIFVDEFKLFRSIECTGHFSFPTKYDQILHKYKRNLIEILEVVKTEKVKSFKINTGFILKTSTATIDTILSENKAYLIENSKTILEMAPIAKKMVGEDSEEELYAYDLEFQINKNYA